MFCPHCRANLPDNSRFCTSCGQAVTPAVVTPSEPTYPMKWYKFLIYFALFAGAVVNMMTGIIQLSGQHYGAFADNVYADFPTLKIVDRANSLALIAGAVFAIFVRFRLSGFKKGAPKLLQLVYIFNLAVSIFYIIGASSAVGDLAGVILPSLTPNAISTSITTAVILIANHIYFKKRASLFVN